ncbi:MAG: hypothetical protein QNJ73_00340 [Gammaproteobacteria bacterium]|nr:hypothetical protein [Gammaproteobacteria bacterium]
MNPLLLIHGYGAEAGKRTARQITSIYGTLPADLRRRYGQRRVVELNVARYVTLEDGIHLDDLARSLDQALQAEVPDLLAGRFDVLVHSLGALVVRNWLRHFSPRPASIERLCYLAGAHFGSGWTHIGRGQLAKWGRAVFQGAEPGVQMLDALELGASDTLDLQRHFLDPVNDLWRRYKTREFCIVGSQVLADWLPIPVRYAHEDGSDGVVRVAAANANWNYIAIEPKRHASKLPWDDIAESCALLGESPDGRGDEPAEHYRVAEQFLADEVERPAVPLAIPFQCAHAGRERGIVTGRRVREELMALLDVAFRTDTLREYRDAGTLYDGRTLANYRRAAMQLQPGFVQGIFNEPRAQYDPHAQLIFRLRDQYGRPVEHADVLLHSASGSTIAANELFEHTHRNVRTPGILTFYLRTAKFDADSEDWHDLLPQVGGVHLEIAPTEPRTAEIRYLPVCLKISNQRLRRFIQGHRTTVVDVTLLRLPSPQTFRIRAATVT